MILTSDDIIPKEHHNVCPVEPPCFGYEPTCWHRWPIECEKCPVQGEVLIDMPNRLAKDNIMLCREGDELVDIGHSKLAFNFELHFAERVSVYSFPSRYRE